MKIVVLAGGLSPERDVSLSSGSKIANALIANGHSVALVDLYVGLNKTTDFENEFYSKDTGKTFSYQVPKVAPDLEALKRRVNIGNVLIGNGVIEICRTADVTFLALHGAMGENGQLQATFDAFGINYTGTGYIGSLLAMDKDIAKRLMVQSDIPTAQWVLFDIAKDNIDDAIDKVGLPCVINPCSCGSSVGVSIIRDKSELAKAIEYAKEYENLVVIERMISGREFSIGVMDGVALPLIEITPVEGFYDYANKYQAGAATEVCPAVLDDSIAKAMQQSALEVHTALKLGFYARIDYLLDADNKFYCLEANTLPGMTPTSLLPQEAQAVGIDYNELCERIARSAKL